MQFSAVLPIIYILYLHVASWSVGGARMSPAKDPYVFVGVTWPYLTDITV